MFTVRVIEQNGHERILEAQTVEVYPSDLTNASTTPKSVDVLTIPGAWVRFSEGEIYVMNSNGKTVAKYLLFDNPPMVEGGSEHAKKHVVETYDAGGNLLGKVVTTAE